MGDLSEDAAEDFEFSSTPSGSYTSSSLLGSSASQETKSGWFFVYCVINCIQT